MKRVSLKKLSLKNFKGVKSLSLNFDDTKQDIYGDNGTFKTTIFDGFTWLLFGKDHNDRTTFEIKTLDTNNNPIPKLQHEVEGEILVNGNVEKLKRVYKEKWVKKKGSAISEMAGHTTDYFINDVPSTLKEFNAKVEEIIDEQLFKLITNPLYFNSLPWPKRRTILESMANILTIQEIAQEKPEFADLMNELNGKSFEDFKRIVGAKKKLVKAELDEIPTRVDELTNSLPETLDFERLKMELESKIEDMELHNEMLIDFSKVDEGSSKLKSEKIREISQKESEIRERKDKIRTLFFAAKRNLDNDLNEIRTKIQNANFDYETTSSRKEFNIKSKIKIKENLALLRNKFDKRQSEKYVFNQETCQTCKQSINLNEEEILELKKNFNTSKVKDLDVMNEQGQSWVKESEDLEVKIEKDREKLDEIEVFLKAYKLELDDVSKRDITPMEETIANDEELKVLESELLELNKELERLKVSSENVDVEKITNVRTKISSLKEDVEVMKILIYSETQIVKGKERIADLETKAVDLAQELAELEGKEFLLQELNTIKLERFEESINTMFPSVRFKLFNHQLNGGVTEVCETLINGVPYDNANNAATIQAGIEIINVLANYNESYAPIFVDNAESVILLPDSFSQIIRLIVFENKSKSLLDEERLNYKIECEIIENKGGIILPSKP